MNEILIGFLIIQVAVFIALKIAGTKEDYNLAKRKNTYLKKVDTARHSPIIQTKTSHSTQSIKVKTHSHKKNSKFNEEELLNKMIKDILKK